MRLDRIVEVLTAVKARAFVDPIRRAVFRDGGGYRDAGVPEALATRLDAEAPLLTVLPARVRQGSGGAAKAVLRLADGAEIESVLLRPSSSRWTVCVSSQAGCGLACSFCATGLLGLRRDLTGEEITDQVLFWRRRQADAGLGLPGNVVFMGMGEPLANYDAVADALRRLTAPKEFNMGAGRLSVSTAGIAPNIERLGQEFPAVRLAVSLHAADDALRDRLVPINKAYPLARLAESLRNHLALSGGKLLIEYVLLNAENDERRHAEALARYLSDIGPARLLHVNLIPYNPTAAPKHRPSEEPRARRFQSWLRAAGLPTTLRRTLGQDVAGACGQLR